MRRLQVAPAFVEMKTPLHGAAALAGRTRIGIAGWVAESGVGGHASGIIGIENHIGGFDFWRGEKALDVQLVPPFVERQIPEGIEGSPPFTAASTT